MISSCVIAALAVPRLGDIIIVITTSSSSCRQIILPGSFFPPLFLQLHRGGEITFFTKPLCCLYCDSGHTPSHSPSLSYEYSTIGVMVKKEKRNQSRAEETAYLLRSPVPPLACEQKNRFSTTTSHFHSSQWWFKDHFLIKLIQIEALINLLQH